MATPSGYQSATPGQTRRADLELLARVARLERLTPDGVWNGTPLQMGSHYLWIDATGDLRVKGSFPTSDLDGVVVGTQS